MSFGEPVSQLSREYEFLSRLYEAQPSMTRFFFDQQVMTLAKALDRGGGPIHYQLPDQIVLEGGESIDLAGEARKRSVSRFFARSDRRDRLIKSLNALEQSMNPALAVCGRLLRYTLARHILYQLLPDGPDMHNLPEDYWEVPSIPAGVVQPVALLTASHAVAEGGTTYQDGYRPQVPYVEAARRFYQPQWVAFDEDDHLLTNSLAEAEACITSLCNAARLLQNAVAVCPSLVVDPTYQRKRAGLLEQLVNQGRALARAHTREIVNKIRNRADAGSLNRGLHLSLPYFDDDSLSLRLYPVEVIPDGRILFAPSFVVRAMRLSEMQIYRDARLNPSTRKHLLAQLNSIESAFNGHSH